MGGFAGRPGTSLPGTSAPSTFGGAYNPSPSTMPVFSGNERTAMTDFFSGEYARAVSALEAQVGGSMESRAAHFYLACAQAALVLIGRENPITLNTARLHLTLAGDAPELTSARQYISPRVLAVLEQQP